MEVKFMEKRIGAIADKLSIEEMRHELSLA
jgi:hypothetical protein